MIQNNQKEEICPLGYWNPSRDHPELLTETNENGEPIAELLRNELYWYAKSNMALVNVYIKVMRQIMLNKRHQHLYLISYMYLKKRKDVFCR